MGISPGCSEAESRQDRSRSEPEQWLLGTFANRYHRFRKVNGKLFQGRFKSLIVEEDAYPGALLHYVRLNPVRAGICDVAGLGGYRWSSYWYLRHPKSRPEFLEPTDRAFRARSEEIRSVENMGGPRVEAPH